MMEDSKLTEWLHGIMEIIDLIDWNVGFRHGKWGWWLHDFNLRLRYHKTLASLIAYNRLREQ